MSKYGPKTGKSKFGDVSEGDVVYVGLDVHKSSVHAAARINGRVVTMVMPAMPEHILATLEPLRPACRKIVYEAGPTGFGLARALEGVQWPVEVIAPGKTPKPANQGSKTDRLDCIKLAEYSEKDLLKRVAIPTEQEEADRLVGRLRNQLVKKQRRVKQQIKGLLLLHGIKEPPGLENWSLGSISALREISLRREARFALDILLDEMEHLHGLLNRVMREVRRLAKEDRHAEKCARLRTHPGVGITVAMKYLTEVFEPGRFSDPSQVASFVGLAPRISQSGDKRREGPLQKAGQGDLRSLLIQASWQWIRRDRQAMAVYLRLLRNTGRKQMAIVGMARRMAVNLWCMLTRDQDYHPLAA